MLYFRSQGMAGLGEPTVGIAPPALFHIPAGGSVQVAPQQVSAIPGADGNTIVIDPTHPGAIPVDQGGDYNNGHDGAIPPIEPPPMPVQPMPTVDFGPGGAVMPPTTVIGLSPMGWLAIAAVGVGAWWIFFGRH